MSEIHTWDKTAANNNSAAPDGWPEGMNYSDVNDAARENMAAAARLYADMNGTLTTAGSANTYTLTPNRTIASYAAGLTFVVKANVSNTGASTLNVSGLGAKSIKRADGSALTNGDFAAGRYYTLAYDGTDFISDIISVQPVNDQITNASAKTTPVDADLVGLVDSADSDSLKKLSWSNIKATLVATALSWTGHQTFKEVSETVYALSGTTPALDPGNGTIQTWTLSGNSSPTDSLTTGQSMTLMVDDGTAYTITWPTITWHTPGNLAPTLNTSGYTTIILWKVGSTLYGSAVNGA